MSLSHSVTESLLTALADPESSLASVARKFNISLGSLTLWLARADTQARVRQMESGASTHIRLAASLNLSSAVRVLTRILDDFHALARSNPDRGALLNDPDYIRASERARKAAYHLYRLSRLVPIDPARLATARSLIEAGPTRVPPVPVEPARQGETELVPPSSPTSRSSSLNDSSSSPPPSSPSRPSRSDTPSPSSSASPTHHSSVAPRDHRGEASSSGSSASSTTSPSASSAALRVESTSSPPSAPPPLCPSAPSASSPRSSDSSAPSAFSSLEDLTAHLEQLAAELGIDTSDIDENAPLPPEFLALFPPDVAAFLAPEPTESPPRSAHVIARAER